MASEEHHRPMWDAWLAVLLIIAGFIVAGLGLIAGSIVTIIVGAVVAVVGGVFGLARGIMERVE